MALTDGFKAKAAALGLGLASVVAPGAMADEQPEAKVITVANNTSPQQVSFATSATAITFSEDAGKDAAIDARLAPGVSVGVALGTQSRATPARIVEVLSEALQNSGIERVSFHFEQNDEAATGVRFFYGKDVSGIHSLDTAKSGAAAAASQYLFQQSQPGMAYEYGS